MEDEPMTVDVRRMSAVMRAFCIGGLVSGGFLCLFDWITSIDGVTSILGKGDGGIVATFLPFIFATLALAFNATSAYFFAMFVRQRSQFTEFSSAVTTIVWFFFVTYDGVSSLLGIFNIFSGVHVESWTTAKEAVTALGGLGTFFAFIVSILLALAPFITAMFGELIKEHSQ